MKDSCHQCGREVDEFEGMRITQDKDYLFHTSCYLSYLKGKDKLKFITPSHRNVEVILPPSCDSIEEAYEMVSGESMKVVV